MKKVKLSERFENAVNTVFENEEQLKNTQIAFSSNSAHLQTQPNQTVTESIGTIIKIFKQIFLFLPGAFFLYMVPMSFVYFLSQFNIKFDGYLGLIFWLLAGSFLTLVGIGNIKETRNLVVPISIISFSLILGVLFSFLPEPLRGDVIGFYSIYLFPLALMIAGIGKGWVDKK